MKKFVSLVTTVLLAGSILEILIDEKKPLSGLFAQKTEPFIERTRFFQMSRTGFEPVTPSLSRMYSPAELTAQSDHSTGQMRFF